MTTTTGTRAILLTLVLVLAVISWDAARGAAQLVPGGPIVMTVNASGDLVPVRATARNTLWVWQPVPVDQLVQVARDHRVVRLLVWTPPGFSEDASLSSWLERLDAAAAEHGIALDALGGDPVWAQRPWLAGAWAAEVVASGRFDHLHLDVEPHALETWEQDS
ncbi:MAG TPA: hypothetical protein PKB06_12700, partial [Actinotalea sp.]|nr:hypothetical protein [Actinotalea sp.]